MNVSTTSRTISMAGVVDPLGACSALRYQRAVIRDVLGGTIAAIRDDRALLMSRSNNLAQNHSKARR
jgi:hypothetical protein